MSELGSRTDQGPARDERGRILPGHSGNPDGRPKIAGTIKELARKYGPEAIEKLAEHMRGDSGDLSLRAAVALLDRGYGKPAQVLSGPDEGAIPVDLDASKLGGRARDLLEALLTAGRPGGGG